MKKVVKKNNSGNHNPELHPENLKQNKKYAVNDILQEVADEVDTDSYTELLKWCMRQPMSKLKFMKDNCADLNAFLKLVICAIVKDVEIGRNSILNEILDRVIGKPVQAVDMSIDNNAQPLQIEVIGGEVDIEKIERLADESK